MPTPRAIISAMASVPVFSFSTWVIREFTLIPAPMATSTVMMGISMAVTDPNSTSSTSTATPSPTAVAWLGPDDSAFSIASPSSATCSVGVRAAWAAAMTVVTAPAGRSLACASKVTTANAVRASREIACPREPYGPATLTTCGNRATWVSIASSRSRTAGSVTVPAVTCTTIWS